jgi:putative NADH-flavin reductase
VADLAVTIVDDIGQPWHVHKRFTVTSQALNQSPALD